MILCNPMDCSMPGSSVLLCLPECSDSHPLSWWCYLTITFSATSFFFGPQSFPASGSFQWIGPRHQVPKVWDLQLQHQFFQWTLRVWFPLGLSGLISLQSRGLSRIFSWTTIRKYQFFVLNLLYGPTLTSVHDYWKNHLDKLNKCVTGQSL